MKFTEIANWSDAECQKFDMSSSYFPISVSRNLLIEYNTLNEKYDALCKDYNKLWNLFKKGKFFGYAIKCPYCGVEYRIPHQDLNRQQIRCMDCGNWYSQDRHVVQLLAYDCEETK